MVIVWWPGVNDWISEDVKIDILFKFENSRFIVYIHSWKNKNRQNINFICVGDGTFVGFAKIKFNPFSRERE